MKILLAVSGGIDSMYLAERAPELFPGAAFGVAHCNFGLRGKESDDDERFVRGWCRSHSVPFHSKRFDTGAYADANGISIEMAARELRYRWFKTLCVTEGFDATAVAHNANDNAETMILNLLRGTGTRGLRGMGGNTRETDFEGMKILRPLLGTSREQIREWMEAEGKSWREDSTNSSTVFKRNSIRSEVFPIFKKLNPSFVRTLAEDAERIAMADDIAEDYFRESLGTILYTDSSERVHVSLGKLRELKHWKYVLQRVCNGMLSRSALSDLESLIESGGSIAGKRFGKVLADSGSLILDGDDPAAEFDVELLTRDQYLRRGLPADFRLDGDMTVLDAGALPQPPVIRVWRPGDWLNPIGLRAGGSGKGKKKVSDLLSDLKYDLDLKASAKVVEMDGSHVAALLCERVDEKAKVTESTATLALISRRK
ncbi:MAG: tRNA lysidine(34) synthetase TilS [Bacteroidales bacterium]|nr:tRNA lysidine(34) synthetase TilS [Bacteroidales bacterium]